MTAKQRYQWEAIIIFFALYPTLLCFFQLPRVVFAFVGCFVSFLVLLICGLILIFRHKTGYGLIPLTISFCQLFGFLGYSRILQ
jgi:hypothetical protein